MGRQQMPGLSKEIQDCREHAAHCARKADLAVSDEAREDFLRLQRSWLDLAHSYEFAEQLLTYSNEVRQRRARRP
jgi:hypothetical protein